MSSMSSTKKSLITSAVSLAVSAVLLISTTFAWFTDSVVNSGNVITSGNLFINAYSYDLDMNNTGSTAYKVDGINGSNEFFFESDATRQNLKDQNAPAIITEDLWEPGKSNAKLLKVENAGSLAAKIKLDIEVDNGGLMDALWFDFIQVSQDGTITGTFDKRPMSSISGFASASEFSLQPNDTLSFILVYGMDENAGNIYMDKNFSANVAVTATQLTSEADGFNNINYDEDAVYPVASISSFKDAIATGGNVSLGNDLVFNKAENPNIDTAAEKNVINRPLTIDLSDHDITLDSDVGNNNWAIFYLNGANAKLTVNGEGTLDATSETGSYCFNLGGSMLSRSTLVINGGTYIGTPSAVNVQYGTAYINGGFFSCRPTTIVDDDQYRYTLNCIDDNYKNGTAKIIVTGGTFVNFNPADNQAEGPGTNFLADGYKVISEEKDTGDIWYTVVPE